MINDSFEFEKYFKFFNQFIVEGTFEFESEEQYSLSHVSENLFGEEISTVSVNSNLRRNQFKIKAIYSQKVLLPLSSLETETLLKSLEIIKKQIVESVYFSKEISDVLILFKHLLSECLKLQKRSSVKIVVLNTTVLEAQNYSESQIEFHKERQERVLNNILNKNVFEPLINFSKDLSDFIYIPNTTLKSLCRSIRNFTGIKKLFSKPNSRIDLFFELRRSVSFHDLGILNDFLIQHKLVEKISLEVFVKIFKESKIPTQLLWTGKIGELRYFIDLIVSEKLVFDFESKLQTTVLHFRMRNKTGDELYKSLRFNKKIITTKKIDLMKEAIKKVVIKSSI